MQNSQLHIKSFRGPGARFFLSHMTTTDIQRLSLKASKRLGEQCFRIRQDFLFLDFRGSEKKENQGVLDVEGKGGRIYSQNKAIATRRVYCYAMQIHFHESSNHFVVATSKAERD